MNLTVSLECHKPAVQLKPGEVKRTVSWPSLVAKQNSIEELQETYRLSTCENPLWLLWTTAASFSSTTIWK